MNDSTLTSWADSEWPAYTPNEILPGLFQGGTEDHEVVGYPAPRHHYERMHSGSTPTYQFDVVITLCADAQPAPWGVHEVRYGFPMVHFAITTCRRPSESPRKLTASGARGRRS